MVSNLNDGIPAPLPLVLKNLLLERRRQQPATGAHENSGMSRSKKSTAPIDRILGLLENVRQSGTGWTAWCPAHNDHNNSLSIAEGSDGRALLHCFAGCDITEIVDALGLELKDLFTRDPTRIRRRRRGSSWV
jgi:hypothetical protein